MMLFIDLGEAYKVPVGSRTSSLDLVAEANFKSVLYHSRRFHNDI